MQLTLDDNRLGPFQRHSESSRKAASDNYPRSGSQRERILKLLLEQPRTREELELAAQLRGSSVRPRIVELMEAGWVQELRDHNGLVERATTSGSMAVVLCATPKARLLGPVT
jgi:hypothetical protein